MVKLEKIQCRALRYVYRDFTSSYSDLRKRSNNSLLYVNRLRLILCEVYKCVYKLNPSYLHELFTFNETVYNTRGNNKLRHKTYNYVKFGKENVSYTGVVLWNNLTDEFRKCITFNNFKQLINVWNGPMCACSSCNICILHMI